MNPDHVLKIFLELGEQAAALLTSNDDWAETGFRSAHANTQYGHDVLVDQMLKTRLTGQGWSVLSEESGHVKVKPQTLLVVVDPVDGSTNAARGLAWYAMSLCAVDAEGPLVGYVQNLATGEAFSAIRGTGVKYYPGLGLAKSPLSPDIKPSGCRSLTEAVVGVSGLPPREIPWQQFRALGAAALDMCAVACGVLDAFVDFRGEHGPWDYLAAVLICREAGVVLAEIDDRPLEQLDFGVRRGPVAAATAELMNELKPLIEL